MRALPVNAAASWAKMELRVQQSHLWWQALHNRFLGTCLQQFVAPYAALKRDDGLKEVKALEHLNHLVLRICFPDKISALHGRPFQQSQIPGQQRPAVGAGDLHERVIGIVISIEGVDPGLLLF
jgi:hypothetical protein